MFNPLRNNKGFSLLECIIALAVFSLAALVLFQLLALSVRQKQHNNSAIEALNAQVDAIAGGGALEREAVAGIVIDFGAATIAGDLYTTYEDTASYKIEKPAFDLSAYELDLLKDTYSSFTRGMSDDWYSSTGISGNTAAPSGTNKLQLTFTTGNLATDDVNHAVMYRLPANKTLVSCSVDCRALTFTDGADTYVWIRFTALPAGGTYTVEIEYS